jgi:hypothetical protein
MKGRSRSEGVASGAEAPFRLSAGGGAEAPPFRIVPFQTAKLLETLSAVRLYES